MDIKNPAKKNFPPGFPYDLVLALSSVVSGSAGSGQSFPSQGLAHLATPVFTRLFITLLQLKPLEKTIILNLFFQDPDGLFNIVVNNSDLNVLQISRPL